VSYNSLTSLPDFLGELPSLQSIRVKGNFMEAFPSAYPSKLDLGIPSKFNFWDVKKERIQWDALGRTVGNLSLLLARDGPTAQDERAIDKFNFVAALLGFDPRVASQVHLVSNEKLRVNFDNFRHTTESKHASASFLFKKDDWKQAGAPEQRQRFLDWHAALANKCPWNTSDPKALPVIPMICGTTEGGAGNACGNGFGTSGTTDAGYYGSGTYFTSKFDYADKYTKEEDGIKWFLVSLVIPGNSFPVVEDPYLPDGSVNEGGYLGKACRTGYQSHLAIVDGSQANALSLKGETSISTVADELVIFNGSQVLPLFAFTVK